MRPGDLVRIELCESHGGHRDGTRIVAPARHLGSGWVTPEIDRPALTAEGDVAFREVLWRWDGTTTADGAYRFRRG